jgi:type IV pilus modification protein PilV
MRHATTAKHTSGGFTLVEVLVGILVFAVGMMALAALQTNLAKNSTDSNARTVAINIGEEVIESVRSFRQITSDGTNQAFNDIVNGERSVRREGYDYTVTSNVTDYYINPADGTVSTDVPAGMLRPDLKMLEMVVSWDPAPDTSAAGRLGSGSVTLTEMISSITSPSGGKVAVSSGDSGSYAPPVNYNPGANPDIISIQLGANKFKESTTPLPDVIRTDELVETTFDVVTYSQDNSGATFLRREEFRAISCVCTLRLPSTGDQGGFRPTIWNGNEYSQAEFVSKPYGVSANNQQSQFCDLCCRDHHDGGTGNDDVAGDPGRSRYNPFLDPANRFDGDSGALAGDHKHYNRDNDGVPVLAASDGDHYVEACRMVRKDGFWRIAQDLRQEGLNAFPADYLDESGEVSDYSDYVTEAVSAYEAAMGAINGYELTSTPSLTQPSNMVPAVVFPASTPGNPTQMASDATTRQQLRSRGIYIDYMSDELRTRINCLDLSNDGDACDAPGVTSALEIIPFYDVQLTWLSRWNETPNNNPIDVTNQAIANNNTHSRGVATLEVGFGISTIDAAVHTGNLGLTGTDPIDPWYKFDEESYDLYALAVDFTEPPELSDTEISGLISSAVPGVKAADVEIEATGAQCDRTNTGFECFLELGAPNPRLKVSRYYKANKVLVACSVELTPLGTEHGTGTSPDANWTRFRLPGTTTTTAHIVIRESNC